MFESSFLVYKSFLTGGNLISKVRTHQKNHHFSVNKIETFKKELFYYCVVAIISLIRATGLAMRSPASPILALFSTQVLNRICCEKTICQHRITWYCARLEPLFPKGYPGSNPGAGVFCRFPNNGKLCFPA